MLVVHWSVLLGLCVLLRVSFCERLCKLAAGSLLILIPLLRYQKPASTDPPDPIPEHCYVFLPFWGATTTNMAIPSFEYSSGFPDKNLSRLGARCELPSTRRKPLTWQFRPREKLTYKVSSKNTCGGFYVSLQESSVYKA